MATTRARSRPASSNDHAPTIALLTDFGTRDPFVGVMKGVIDRIAPRARVIDLTHEIPAQNVRAAAIALFTSFRFFAPKTIFVCVVDPGVGTNRRILAARTHDRVFLAPDNGLLSLVLDDHRAHVRVVENRDWFLDEVSSTFHGRDVFAPVGAHLANGGAFTRVGRRVDEWQRIELPRASRVKGVVRGEILDFDRFGNARTNVPRRMVREGDAVRLRGKVVARVARAYGDVAHGEAVAMIGSAGLLEIAVNGGEAQKTLRLRAADRLEIRPIR